jgi:SAM-dependent methyltransferase
MLPTVQAAFPLGRTSGQAMNVRRRWSFVTPRALAVGLRNGNDVSDEDFDHFFAGRFTEEACHQSTPVAVAMRAARLLTEGKAARVLDIGAGLGKFCIVGALATRGLFTGIEPRPRLVLAARGAAARFGVGRIGFVRGSVVDIDFRFFDGIYLYPPQRFDADVPNDSGSLLKAAWHKLREARKGTRIVTFHSDEDPPGCELTHAETVGNEGSRRLAVFIKI